MPIKTPQVPSFTARNTAASGQVNLETRVRQLEEHVARLEAIIKITGRDVEIKTFGKIKIKASSIDLDGGRSVRAAGIAIAHKGDRITVSGQSLPAGAPLFLDGKIE